MTNEELCQLARMAGFDTKFSAIDPQFEYVHIMNMNITPELRKFAEFIKANTLLDNHEIRKKG